MTRLSKFFQFFNMIAFVVTLSIVVPISSPAQARCGVGCTYAIANKTITGAFAAFQSFIQNVQFKFEEALQQKKQVFETAENDKTRLQASTERGLISDSVQVGADKTVYALDALSNNDTINVRKSHQAGINLSMQNAVETVCPAMSRMQNFAAAKFVSDHMYVETERETTNLNTGVKGYYGASSPLDFDVNNAKQALYFTNPNSYNGGASNIASAAGLDSMLNKASFSLSNPQVPDDANIQKISGVGGAAPEDIDLDIRPGALLDKLAIAVGSDPQKAFTTLTNHVGGGPTAPITASNLQNASASTLQALNQVRSFAGFQNIGLLPYIRAMSDRMTSSSTSPSEAVPVLNAMMDDLQFPDELKAKFKQDERFSYASMRDLIAYFPVFNPKEFAETALFGINNAKRRSLMYQGFNVAFTVELIKKMEMNNLLMGAMLLRDLNKDSRPAVDAIIGNGNLRSASTLGIDSDEQDMKQFINAAIRGTDAAIQAAR